MLDWDGVEDGEAEPEEDGDPETLGVGFWLGVWLGSTYDADCDGVLDSDGVSEGVAVADGVTEGVPLRVPVCVGDRDCVCEAVDVSDAVLLPVDVRDGVCVTLRDCDCDRVKDCVKVGVWDWEGVPEELRVPVCDCVGVPDCVSDGDVDCVVVTITVEMLAALRPNWKRGATRITILQICNYCNTTSAAPSRSTCVTHVRGPVYISLAPLGMGQDTVAFPPVTLEGIWDESEVALLEAHQKADAHTRTHQYRVARRVRVNYGAKPCKKRGHWRQACSRSRAMSEGREKYGGRRTYQSNCRQSSCSRQSRSAGCNRRPSPAGSSTMLAAPNELQRASDSPRR